MRNVAVIRSKMKRNLALNLTELAIATGYDRGSLTAMMLPLIFGKICYSDFRRVIAARQDRLEHSRSRIRLAALRHSPITDHHSPAAASPAGDRPLRAIADKFRAPKSMRGRPVASHAPAGSRARSTG